MQEASGRDSAAELAAILADYRLGEIEPITAQTIEGFARNVQEICMWMGDDELRAFLSGLRNCIGRQYWSRARVEALFTSQTFDSTPDLHIVHIQEDESSQATFVKLLRQSSEGPSDETQGLNTRRLLYVDDATFTGRALARNLQLLYDRLALFGPSQRELLVFHLLQFDSEVYPRIDPVVKDLESIGVKVEFQSAAQDSIHSADEQHLRLSPTTAMLQEDYFLGYLRRKKDSLKAIRDDLSGVCLAWPDRGADPLFDSPMERQVVTRALLQVGAQLLIWSKDPYYLMRPLGFVAEKGAASLGFGTMFCTFHNSANTSPLALWWGNPSVGSYSPLSKWTPLLPRRPQ
jgi:hypothetical protein